MHARNINIFYIRRVTGVCTLVGGRNCEVFVIKQLQTNFFFHLFNKYFCLFVHYVNICWIKSTEILATAPQQKRPASFLEAVSMIRFISLQTHLTLTQVARIHTCSEMLLEGSSANMWVKCWCWHIFFTLHNNKLSSLSKSRNTLAVGVEAEPGVKSSVGAWLSV